MSWFFVILILLIFSFLKRLIGWGENEGSGGRNPPHSDHGISRRDPDRFTPSTSQSSIPNKSSVDSGISFGGVSECLNPSKPPFPFSRDQICLSPLPSPLSVNQKNPVDSTVNEKSTITAEQKTIKSTPEKGNEGSRTGNNVASASSASFSQHSSKASLSSYKPVICSSGPIPLQSASKPLLSSSGPLSSASKATAAPLKASPSPTPCPLDKTNPATPISSTITSPPLYSDFESDSPPFSKGTSPFSSMPMPDPFGPPDPPNRNTYFLHEGATPIYEIPEDIKNLIKRDIVPDVLKEPLSPWTYKDYFATLLYAEDFYVEKWTNFCLENVTLELEEASIYNHDTDEYEEKLFVVFEINWIPERRPFLLLSDFVLLRPAGKKVDPFEGILHRVVKRNRDVGEFDDYHVVKRDIVFAEFGDDFHLQHSPDFKYDVSFSFNRVCLKRSHQAIAAATNLLFQKFLFPLPFIPSGHDLDRDQISAVEQILMFRGSPPYLIDGPLWRTELVIREAVLQIYKSSPGCRILVSAPTNRTCDSLVESLDDEIPELDMFRANAAFREIDVVPGDILPLCQYEGECFTCPPLERLKNIKVIFSTFMSSFRLHNEGLPAGHFSHIFLVDASSAMEPEALVVLTNLVDENTIVVVTGTSGNSPKWVRSDIARRYGLKKSYFQRLLESEPYCDKDSVFVTNL